MTIVTRFPPSPTGFMHIGTARTALFNWLYARKHQGKMLFRIEDTDRERHSEAAVQAIINGLNWLGLDWDGEIVSQYARRERHAAVAHELVKSGKAYFCYCTPEELDAMREKAVAEGRSQFYDRRWRDRDPSEAPVDVKPVIRIKAPLSGERVVHDVVQGDVKVTAENLDDMIILRSDGVPTYMLAVVVDDHDMGVTHVIRGDDHLNNTFRQNLIYEAMGWPIPTYAHLPLILGPDGAKLSKRHGATGVEEYRDMGYLPEAMRAYLLRLGWSYGDEDIVDDARALELFDLSGIGQSAARFDFEKLNSVNAHFMKLADDARLVDLVIPLLEKRGFKISPISCSWMLKLMPELKSRAKTLLQLSEESEFLFKTLPLDFDEKAKAQLNDDGFATLRALIEIFQNTSDYTASTIDAACRTLADQTHGGKLAKVMMPLRAALTGRMISPTLPHVMEVMGKDEVINRLKSALTLTS
jgi:glutamyl-tRNA synthetase